MTVQQQVRNLLERYCERLFDQIKILDEVLSNKSNIGAPSSAITGAREITHEMRGTAGSLGFPDIAALGAALDDDLKRLVEQDRISAAQLHVSKALFVELRRIASQANPQKSLLHDADLSILARGAGSIAPPRTAHSFRRFSWSPGIVIGVSGRYFDGHFVALKSAIDCGGVHKKGEEPRTMSGAPTHIEIGVLKRITRRGANPRHAKSHYGSSDRGPGQPRGREQSRRCPGRFRNARPVDPMAVEARTRQTPEPSIT
jgi:HPt (histidine-containing phosphotransfer) domain-containing protein